MVEFRLLRIQTPALLFGRYETDSFQRPIDKAATDTYESPAQSSSTSWRLMTRPESSTTPMAHQNLTKREHGHISNAAVKVPTLVNSAGSINFITRNYGPQSSVTRRKSFALTA